MKKLILSLMLSVLLLGFGSAMAATSQIDNLPGGAGIASWVAGGGWETLINVQNTNLAACAAIHAAVYDRDSNHLFDFIMNLSPADNVGIIIQSGGSGIIAMYDYSDSFYPTPSLNDIAVGPAVTRNAVADADGISRGYITIVKNNVACQAVTNQPVGNISGVRALVTDDIFVRSAFVSANAAYAFNGTMLQGFLNMGANINEGIGDWFDYTQPNIAAALGQPCNWDRDAVAGETYNSIDDGLGANIDFIELFLSVNVPGNPAASRFMCFNNRGVPALGSSNQAYWGRWNENALSNTTLTLIAPNNTGAQGVAYPRNLTVITYNDDETGVSWGPFAQTEVSSNNWLQPGGIAIPSGATAGEARITIPAPIIGYTLTETSSYADVYPLVREQIAISAINEALLTLAAGGFTPAEITLINDIIANNLSIMYLP